LDSQPSATNQLRLSARVPSPAAACHQAGLLRQAVIAHHPAMMSAVSTDKKKKLNKHHRKENNQEIGKIQTKT
jgi:hypothetical protein